MLLIKTKHTAFHQMFVNQNLLVHKQIINKIFSASGMIIQKKLIQLAASGNGHQFIKINIVFFPLLLSSFLEISNANKQYFSPMSLRFVSWYSLYVILSFMNDGRKQLLSNRSLMNLNISSSGKMNFAWDVLL